MTDLSMERVLFTLPPDSWHGHGSESLWAEPMADGGYRIDNVPFFVTGISVDDVVAARPAEGGLLAFEAVLRRGGHSTYRIAPVGSLASIDNMLQELASTGCTWEEGPGDLIAVDVPAETDLYRAYEILESGFEAKLWEFEEGHVGHSLRLD